MAYQQSTLPGWCTGKGMIMGKPCVASQRVTVTAACKCRAIALLPGA
ncbi:hypothetical protein [Nonomuraea sp. NPDC002799]